MPRKILVVVDYQKDFIIGALGFLGADRLDARIAARIRQAADNGEIIVVTKDTHHEDYLDTREGKALPILHCIFGTPGWELYGKTATAIEQAKEKVPVLILEKATFGVSPVTMCQELLKFEDIEEIELVGLVTNMCVISNVCCFQAMWPNAQIIVHADMVDSFDKELHQKTLDVLRGLQVNVVEPASFGEE